MLCFSSSTIRLGRLDPKQENDEDDRHLRNGDGEIFIRWMKFPGTIQEFCDTIKKISWLDLFTKNRAFEKKNRKQTTSSIRSQEEKIRIPWTHLECSSNELLQFIMRGKILGK